VQPPRGVVAGRSGDGPVVRQLLVALEDLLRDDPRAARGFVQPPQVAARVGEAVGVVDAEPVDHPRGVQLEQQRVRGVEDLGVLDPDRGECADVEEPAVVELLVRDAPVREPVVLATDELGERQVLRLGAHGEDVVVVAQHHLLAELGFGRDDGVVHDELARGQHVADARAEHGHEQPVRLLVEVDVEPARVRRLGTVPQHRPQRPVVPRGRRHRHVVGDHVDDHAHAAPVRRRGERLEPLAPAQHVADPRVVDDVVPVRRAGRRPQDGGEVEVGDAEGAQVVQRLLDVGEGEVRSQLEPVGADRHATSGPGQVGVHANRFTRGGRLRSDTGRAWWTAHALRAPVRR
jgi:hypothetical protein